MTHHEAFLAAIRAEPDDDAPRLIYADWLQETGDAADRARGAFIRLQCERMHPGQPGSRRSAAMQEAARLLRDHWDAWLRPLRSALGSGNDQWLQMPFHADALDHFPRGFVEALTLSLGAFLERAEVLFRLTPLCEVRLMGAGGRAAALAASPHLRELIRLRFVDYYREPLGPADVRVLAGSPYLTRLSELSLSRNNLGDAGAVELAAAPWFGRLTRLDLLDNGLSGDGFRALLRSPQQPRLAHLRLADNLPGDAGVEELAQSPMLSSLKSLDLSRCALGDAAAAALAASPHLVALTWLDLGSNRFEAAGRRRLRLSFGDRVWL